jgi:hypothetical protein
MKMIFCLFIFIASSCSNTDPGFFDGLDDKGYSINISDSYFLNKKVQQIELKDSSNIFVVYYTINIDSVDSDFIEVKTNYYMKQSCSNMSRDTSVQYFNFKHKSNYYLVKECAECSDMFNENCYRAKKDFLELFNSREYEKIDW